jgi:tetratricopeptide (TPR) repeat protein
MARQPPQSSSGSTQAALQAAAVAVQQGRPEEGERIAREILTHNAGEIGAMFMLGHALLAQKRVEEAIPPLERAAQQSRDPAIHTRLCMALRQAGRTDDAMSRLKRVIKREPFAPAFVEYGVLLTQFYKYDEAREVFTRGLAAAPNYPDLLMAAAGFFQASCDFPKAAELYRRFLTFDQGNVAARIWLGICQLELGDRDGAFQNFRAVTKGNRDMLWRVMGALTHAGHGALWLDVKDAEAALL